MNATIALIVQTIASPNVVNNTEATVELRNAPTNSVKTEAQVAAAAIAPSSYRGIERNRAPAQMQSCLSEIRALVGIGLLHRLGDLRHEIGDPRQPRREHVQQGCYAREQENRRQRHLDDVGDQIERRARG